MDANFSLNGKKIWVPGCRGMVGSATVRRLQQENVEILATARQDCDLINYGEVDSFYKKHKPQVVFIAAAKVGGIYANNTYPADFIYENITMSTNIIHLAKEHKVEKLVFMGSNCIYPRNCPQPIKESYLLSGELEETNQWYAIAKIAGINLCQAYRRQYGCDFISIMPANLYGPNDNFHPENSHVAAALLKRFHEARRDNKQTVTIWGTGTPMREFLHVDDLADALIFLANKYSAEEPINVGTGTDISIAGYAKMVAKITGYTGNIEFDTNYPDGTPRKLLDVSRLRKLGWHHKISLDEGLPEYYNWFLQNYPI